MLLDTLELLRKDEPRGVIQSLRLSRMVKFDGATRMTPLDKGINYR